MLRPRQDGAGKAQHDKREKIKLDRNEEMLKFNFIKLLDDLK